MRRRRPDASNGVSVGQGSGLDLRNNIISHNGGWGIAGSDSRFTALDYNLLFQNTSGPCSACSAGPNDATGDPLYANTTDYSLDPSSPAIDAGLPSSRSTGKGSGLGGASSASASGMSSDAGGGWLGAQPATSERPRVTSARPWFMFHPKGSSARA